MRKSNPNQAKGFVAWHAKKGHYRRAWSALRLPCTFVEYIRLHADDDGVSPTDWLAGQLGVSLRRMEHARDTEGQLSLFDK